MRIALCSTMVPFVHGGARNIVEWLQTMLVKAGHEVERVYLPELDVPELLFQQMMAFRWVDLSAADLVICFRPQAHLIRHPNKVVWFIHHLRSFYDLWDTGYRGFPDDLGHRGIRDALRASDDAALAEARLIFTNSKQVSDRLSDFNGVTSEVLYPPLIAPERFYCRSFNDEIVCICRLEHHKRQHLLVEAMKYTRTPVRLRLCGSSSGCGYPELLRRAIEGNALDKRIVLDERWISEEEKVELLASCLASAYFPLDEDSYGYPSLESSYSSKAILTASDSGGVLELVEDGVNGVVVDPEPRAIAVAMDNFYLQRERTKEMGVAAMKKLSELNISWEHVLRRLLA
ncbi:glycosyltransferase [Dyella sp. M7H15-1]|uniref:glycosyltransferase family 4 protein n=1 Tax=Dyella sp. M7H15-1 TaxID=2501295 RepID=UPI0010051451|nr:glycosyltransferase family 4 protein [Dyella sp. M7H15-1]QAU24996.1 glycosyltransferase [Dyella sp. M7H15-1]